MIGIVIGTRPELIKLRPIFHALKERGDSMSILYVKQHPAIEEEVRALDPGYHTFTHVLGLHGEYPSRTLGAMEDIAEQLPNLQLGVVQGDTTTAAGAALAMAYQKIPVVHVEAGLRTVQAPIDGPRFSAPHIAPFPEELNRQLIARVASLHLAPTYANEQNLKAERVGGKIVITGNPGISVLASCVCDYQARVERIDDRTNIVVTCHRRENWHLIERLAFELIMFSEETGARVVFVMHPNPELRAKLTGLDQHPDLIFSPPVSHLKMVGLLMSADLVVTDSGGIIEEATWLRKRLVVIRSETERPEASARVHPIPGCRAVLHEALKGPEPTEGSRYAFGEPLSARRCADEIHAFYWNHCFRHD